MSRIPFAGNMGIHWTTDQTLFTNARDAHGPLAVRHGQHFGGSSAYALLGPDICITGGATNHTPSATGAGWDSQWAHANAGGPAIWFTQDGTNSWKRGHLINAEWGGSGSNWNNLVPLTSRGNSNHKTVENRMKVYLQNFRAFDKNGNNNYWYGLQYWVQASVDPWAAHPAPIGDLYSYAPNMIKVTWRIVVLPKLPGALPNSTNVIAQAQHQIANGVLTPATALNIAQDLPNFPTTPLPGVLVNNAVNVAAAGGMVHPLSALAPAIPLAASPFDGTVEVMQD